jgi:hypothetical protein
MSAMSLVRPFPTPLSSESSLKAALSDRAAGRDGSHEALTAEVTRWFVEMSDADQVGRLTPSGIAECISEALDDYFASLDFHGGGFGP